MTREEEATNKIIEFIDIVKDVPKNESILAIGLDIVEWADRTMLDKVCERLDKCMCNTSNGIKVKNYQSVGELIYNLRKEIWE